MMNSLDTTPKPTNPRYCLLCVGNITSARVLECEHGFCETCLGMYYETFHNVHDKDKGSGIPCPTCRKLTSVPDDGLLGLAGEFTNKQSGFGRVSLTGTDNQPCDICILKTSNCSLKEASYYCNKCVMNLCDSCYTRHCQQILFKSHQTTHISSKEMFTLYCDVHSKLQCKFYCSECKVPACTACLLLQHNGHRAVELRTALALQREDLHVLLNTLGQKLDKLESTIKHVSFHFSSSTMDKNLLGIGNAHPHSRSNSTRSKDTTRFRNFSHSGESLKLIDFNIDNQKNELKVRKNHSFSGGVTPSNISRNHSPRSFSESYRPLETLSAESQSRMSLSSFENLSTNIERIRTFYNLSIRLLEASQSKKLLTIYRELKLRIKTILSCETAQIQESMDVIRKGSPGSCTPISSVDSTYSLMDFNCVEQTASLNNHYESKQSLLIAPKLVWKLEKQRNDIGELYNPCDVEFMPDGSLIVAEYDMVNDKNNRLRIFDQNGYTKEVWAQGKIRPLGVAIMKDGNIVVTDCKDKRLKVYTPSGQHIFDIGKGQFGWPYGVAVNSHGQIIVTDAFNDSVSIYHNDGKRIKQFGSSGSNQMQFKNPYHVAVDSKDNVIISDSGNNCVKVFDSSGRFIFKTSEVRRKLSMDYLDTRKSRRKKLKGPRGICIDHKGNILVADDYSRICMFDESGNFLRNLMTEDDHVKYPEAIGCSRQGQIAVTEWNPNNMLSIKLFNMYE